MKIEVFKELLDKSWSMETCYPDLKSEWNENNPTLGQGDITALLINDFYGGKIMRCMTSTRGHYYNLIDDEIIDLTVAQFQGETPKYDEGKEITRDYLLQKGDTKNRYKLFLYRMKQSIRKYDGKKYRLIGPNGKEYLSENPGTLLGNKKSKIYGQLNCPVTNKWIEKGFHNNRVFFIDEETAIDAGYRPCSVCMPEEYKKWKEKQEIKKLLLNKNKQI